MASKTRVTIIGGGIGGYPAAIRAARMGAAVTLIEKDVLGGTCLNRGCIPTKALLHAGEVVHTMQESEIFGISCKGYAVDFAAVAKRKDTVVKQLRIGVESLLKTKKIRMIKGTATFKDASTLRILETEEELASDRILIATGSSPSRLKFEGADGPDVLDSTRMLELTELPGSIVIIGGGVIGVEFAQIFSRLGVRVTILEAMENLIPGFDGEIAQALEKSLEGAGIDIMTRASVTGISHNAGGNDVRFRIDGKESTVTGDKVVMAVGRRPEMAGLGVERIGLATEKGALKVDEFMQTSVPHIYAAGDVTGGIMLAHMAAAESECAIRNALGEKRPMSYRTVPGCIYTSPEVAGVGLTEEAARERYKDVEIGRFPFFACGKALVINRTAGIVKIVSEKKYKEVLGVHIIGPRATDMIAEAVLGMSLEMTVEELAEAIHPHPTLTEAIAESAMTLHGGAIHMP
ncbi:dihydrolipoyl dehydrogenase [Desulfatirhabdium butyrativorans]|uniref:dihydrolipoyl dehydrogenase n=1 Tax=Desulfatirhabdium butyrativorans TaxID=340467 RepID=UPI00040C7026|nr:dihydrolipoyl dehydrogenase [Desulfatirhabdium butyrativorans]